MKNWQRYVPYSIRFAAGHRMMVPPQACSAQLRLYNSLHIRRNRHGTVVADVQHMAAAFAEAGVDGAL